MDTKGNAILSGGAALGIAAVILGVSMLWGTAIFIVENNGALVPPPVREDSDSERH